MIAYKLEIHQEKGIWQKHKVEGGAFAFLKVLRGHFLYLSIKFLLPYDITLENSSNFTLWLKE